MPADHSTSSAVLDQLRKAVNGAVITPSDPTYDKVRTVVAGDVDGHPAAVVRVTDADDVARVVDIARDAGAELAIRSGGHSGAGHSTTDGGIVIDVRDLNRIEFDLDDRSASACTGTRTARRRHERSARTRPPAGAG